MVSTKMVVGLTAVVVGCMVSGCSSDDGGTTSGMASSSGTSGTTSSSGSSGGTMTTYERLGGKAGLESFTKNIVETKVLTDADLKTFFFNQVASPIPAGHPSAGQIVVCFARFVGAALKADTYPGAPVNDPANTNTPNFTCRDMIAAHKSANTKLNIGEGNFDKFVGAIAASLQPLVKPTATKAGEITQAEFDALAAALTGQKSDVTTPGANSTGPFKAQ
jgi:hypothetical protein